MSYFQFVNPQRFSYVAKRIKATEITNVYYKYALFPLTLFKNDYIFEHFVFRSPPSQGTKLCPIKFVVDSSWNVMAHVDARVGKWRGNWRMEWVSSTLHTTSEHGVSSITTADAHTSVASSRLNWRPPADLNGLVRFAERRNLVSARVPSYFNWRLLFLYRLACTNSRIDSWDSYNWADARQMLSCALFSNIIVLFRQQYYLRRYN